MPTKLHKNKIKQNDKQSMSKSVGMVELFYSNIRKGKPLLGLTFYDALGRKIMQVGHLSMNKTVLKLAEDEKIMGFRSSG